MSETLGKPQKKCQTHIQLKFTGVDQYAGQELTLTLGEISQTKMIDVDDTDVAFNIKFKGDKKVKVAKLTKKPTEADVYCPQANETLSGNLTNADGTLQLPVAVTILKTKGGKPTKVTYDLADTVPSA